MKKTLRFIVTCLFLLGFSLQFDSCRTTTIRHGCLCYKDMTKGAESTLTVSSSHIEDFYSTDEASGALTADGGCHANMNLVFRWADDDLAKTDTRPPLSYEFQSLFGYFPTNLGMETISTTAEGINEYRIFVSQAADAENPEATRYGIWVKYVKGVTTESGAITCNISISYYVYNEAFWKEGCEMDE